MRSLIYVLSLLLLISCQQDPSNLNKDRGLATQLIVTNPKENLVISDRQKERKNKWFQYKRIPVINSNDTIPIKNNYLLIEADVVIIYIDDVIIEKHKLIRDNQYSFPSYYFEDKPDDILQYLDKEKSKLVIKRDNFDGLQEYYIKKDME